MAAKKKSAPVTRITAKQKFTAYRDAASSYIYGLQNPIQNSAFSVKGYEVTPTGKKPNFMSAPEVLAIVMTARKLGKTVNVTTSGVADGGQLDFYFVDGPRPLPEEMRGY
jgi:hypothetical protein